MSRKKKSRVEASFPKIPEAPRVLNAHPAFSRRHILAVILMLALTLMAYANTFHASFQFDDEPNIVKNPSVHLKTFSLQWLSELIQANYKDSLRIFAFFTFGLNYYFGGLHVFGYHLVNLLIHLGSGLFVYGFLLLTLNLPSLRERYGSIAFPVALFTSLLFLVHPIQTQSVTYIVQRMTSLGGMFYLLGLFLYVKGRLSPGNRRGLFWTGAGLSYLLGLFTKENVAILPLFAALYEIYFFRNVDLGPRGKKGLVYSMGLVLLIGLLMCLFWGQRYIDVIIEGYQVRNFTMAERVLTQFRVVLYYVMLLVYPAPSRLNLDYDFPTSHGILDPPATLLSILIVFSLIGYGLWSARKRPLISYFILWYFGNLVIESSIFPLEMVYEHRLYLPSIGPFVLFTVLVVKGWEKVRERMRHGSELGVRSSEREAATFLTKKGDLIRARMTDTDTLSSDYPLWGLFLILAVSLAWASYERNKVWRDPTALWEDCVKKSPRKDRPYYNLGQEYYTQGRFQDSIEALKTANRLNPKDVKILNNLGAAYRKTGRYPEAIETYKEALRLNPTESEPYNNLGLAYYHLGRHPEAIEAFKEAIRRKPGNEELYYNLGVAYTALGNHPAAIEAYHKAIQIKHDHVQARVNLAVSYLMLKKRDIALEQYQVLKDLDRGRAEKVLGLINSNR